MKTEDLVNVKSLVPASRYQVSLKLRVSSSSNIEKIQGDVERTRGIS